MVLLRDPYKTMNKKPKPNLLFAFSSESHKLWCSDKAAMERLSSIADHSWLQLEGTQALNASGYARFGPNEDVHSRELLMASIGEIDALVIHDGSPLIDAEILRHAPRLKFICDVEGDRFGFRFNLEDCWQAGVRTIDTNNGNSYPVAEWALGLILVSLRNAGTFFRGEINSDSYTATAEDKSKIRDLFGSSVGLIGGGFIAQRLISFLRPFECNIVVHDPYISKAMAHSVGFDLAPLDVVMQQDVVVCLVPITPATKGLISEKEFSLMNSGSVFINVSRGAVVDTNALINRLRHGDIVAGLDVFDPEPIPQNHPIKSMPNVFLTPHIAAYGNRTITNFTLMIDELERHLSGIETRFDLTPTTRANRRGEPPIQSAQ